jgi:hypothetical protein
MKRIHCLALLAASLLTAGLALAAPPTVEIVAMPHPPVVAALKPLRAWLAEQGRRLKVVEVDADSAQGARRLEAVGLRGHVPVVILVDGQYRHALKDGRPVAFVNFPDVEGAPPAVRGKWTTADVQAVLATRMQR